MTDNRRPSSDFTPLVETMATRIRSVLGASYQVETEYEYSPPEQAWHIAIVTSATPRPRPVDAIVLKDDDLLWREKLQNWMAELLLKITTNDSYW